MTAIVPLNPGDEDRVDAFLARHADSSMMLRSNLRRAGLHDDGRRFGGAWVAAVDEGAIVGVACHAWSGMVALQAPEHAGGLAVAAVARSGRGCAGLVGPWSQVVAARADLGMADRAAPMDSCEDLFSLALADLRVPDDVAAGRVVVRRGRPEDAVVLVPWRYEYEIEAIRRAPGDDSLALARAAVGRGVADGSLWVADAGALVAMSAFNATLPDCVQIGGVYTPPALRGRGYARACVAGSLLAAREEGVARSILFTGVDNEPARRAYLALGYRIVGDYGIVLFET